MANKFAALGAGTVTICLLFGAWYMIKTNNEKAQLRASEESAGDTIVDISQTDVSSLTFNIGEDAVTFVTEEDGWYMESDEDFPVNSTEISSLLSYFGPLKAVRTLEDVNEISEFGLDAPANVFLLKNSEGNETTITIGDNNEGTGDDYVMKDDETDVIYTISSSLRNAVGDDIYDYAVSEEIPSFSSDNIVGVIVKRDGDTYELQKGNEEWTVLGNDTELDQDDMEMAVSNLGYLSYTGYADYHCTDEKTYGFDSGKEITIIYEVIVANSAADGEDGTEDLSSVEQHTLTFRIGDTDPEGNYYVQQEDSEEVHTLSDSVLDNFLNLKLGE
ncbi:MAG: DUF4340 domain-containing protein [Eubacteriales bacterium]|nr:DUF4340 domain-containing protein [Eubacteriales bacterium]